MQFEIWNMVQVFVTNTLVSMLVKKIYMKGEQTSWMTLAQYNRH